MDADGRRCFRSSTLRLKLLFKLGDARLEGFDQLCAGCGVGGGLVELGAEGVAEAFLVLGLAFSHLGVLGPGVEVERTSAFLLEASKAFLRSRVEAQPARRAVEAALGAVVAYDVSFVCFVSFVSFVSFVGFIGFIGGEIMEWDLGVRPVTRRHVTQRLERESGSLPRGGMERRGSRAE